MLATESNVEVRHEFLQRMTQARSETDKLFELVKSNSLYERPIPERHRIVFYIGHLEAFDWNLIARRGASLEAFHPGHDRLFAFGIDPTDGGLPNDVPSDWPSLGEVRRYNDRTRATIDDLLAESDLADPSRPLFRDGLAFHVAIEHRLMHAETLAYMFHQMPLAKKHPRSDPPAPPARGANDRMVRIPAGTATLGL